MYNNVSVSGGKLIWCLHFFIWIPVRALIPAGLLKSEGKGRVRPKDYLFLSCPNFFLCKHTESYHYVISCVIIFQMCS